MGVTCGRREREADAGNEEERSSPVPAVCNGGRHPDPRDADSLRGLSEERGSWSVRLVCAGLVPANAIAPTTTGVLWKNEEGNVVSVRQAHALFVVTPKKRPPRSRTRPSLGPETRARQSSLNSIPIACGASRARSRTAQAVGNRTGWRDGRDIAVGQTCASRRNRHRGHDRSDACAARRVSPLLGVTREGRA
jgi:hypothetical protein